MTKIQTPQKNLNGKKEESENSEKTKSSRGEKTLEKLFETELKDIYSAEKQLVEALPAMAKAADNEELQDALEYHLQETKRQVERLEKVFDRLQIDGSQDTKCEAMEGLLREKKKILDEFEAGPVRDAALIIGAQKIEHYEIASYGSLCELANVLGYTRVESLLGRSLDEEEEADRLLSDIAQQVNDEACETNVREHEFI